MCNLRSNLQFFRSMQELQMDYLFAHTSTLFWKKTPNCLYACCIHYIHTKGETFCLLLRLFRILTRQNLGSVEKKEARHQPNELS